MLFHTCTPACPPQCSAKAPGPEVAGRPRPFTVDLHCHALNPGVEALVADQPQKQAEPEFMLKTLGAASAEHNNAHMLPVAGPRLVNLALRLADMDAMGVDLQVVSPSPTQYYYWAEAELAEQIVRISNEGIAALCDAHPERLTGLGTLALQHPGLAVEQLDHAVRTLGLHGVEISTAVNGLDLDHPSLNAFWARADSLNAVVFIHPLGTSLGERLNRYYLQNIVGQPLETTVALSSLIFSGVLDRHPGVKIVAAHGGGYLPAYAGRSDHGYAVRPEAGAPGQRPSEYLKRIWFDSLVYGPQALRQLLDTVGVRQVVVGTDYPFDMGHYDVHGLIEAVPGLTDAERALLLGGNASRLLGLQERAESAQAPAASAQAPAASAQAPDG